MIAGLLKVKKSNKNNISHDMDDIPLTVSEWEQELYRNKFSRYLPWIAFDSETKLYYCDSDGGEPFVGFLWECTPGLFVSEQDAKTLEGLLRLGLPDDSVMQFILIADPYIVPILETYKQSKPYAPEYVQEAYKSLADFYLEKTQFGQVPIRIFRSFVTLKIYERDINKVNLSDIKTSVEEILGSVGLFPRIASPDVLLHYMRRLFNDEKALPEDKTIWGNWCQYTELRKQIIMSQTEIVKEGNELRIGQKYFRCITPKTLPNTIDLKWANEIIGSYAGISGDASQINTPFLYTLNIVFRDLKTKLHAKASLTLSQQAFGSFIAGLKRRQEEFLWVADLLEKGDKFFEVIPILWVYSEDKETTRDAVFRAKRIWESTGAVMQEDTALLLPLFIYSLPFGYISKKKNMLPVQADYMGTGVPVLLFVGRKGQLIGIDLFHQKASNNNFFIVAPSGKGKSFTANYILGNYFGLGAKIRVVDIGRSYMKLCQMFGGRFINFAPGSDICLNPFSFVQDPEYDLPAIAAVVQAMATVQTGTIGSETPETMHSLIQAAVKWAWEARGRNATVHDVFMYLSKFPEIDPETYDILCDGKEHCSLEFQRLATHIAYNLSKFAKGGQYEKWFIGEANLELSQDRFVVLELEEIKQQTDLFQVIVLLIMNLTTSELYLSDRMTPHIILFDEAYMFLTDNEAMKKVIEEGYRRARKYRGAFGIITQSVLDMEQFGAVGRVIKENSEFKFFLESDSFELAKEKKLINYDPFTMEILKSVKYNAPKYSELFLHSDTFGAGVVRLQIDPYSYYVYTSNPKEIAEIEQMVAQGMDYKEAIEEMIRKYKRKE